MLRFVLVLAAGLTALSATDLGNASAPVSTRTTMPANGLEPVCLHAPYIYFDSASALASLQIVLFDYSAYDTASVLKIKRFIKQQLPGSQISDFWEGSQADLAEALVNADALVVIHPANDKTQALRTYTKVISQYIRAGGTVVFTGTHEYTCLQQFGLMELDYGYFCDDPSIHAASTDHPILNSIPADFKMDNYAYPLDISDPGFVTLADVRSYPVIGYKNIGTGRLIYLGLEYYHNEKWPNRILANTLLWAAAQKQTLSVAAAEPAITQPSALRPPIKRTEEVLRAGSDRVTYAEMKAYPNPYVNKCGVDLDLNRAVANVSIDLLDETGRLVFVLLPGRSLSAGNYHVELPSYIPTGTYYIYCQIDDRAPLTRKVVKTTGQ